MSHILSTNTSTLDTINRANSDAFAIKEAWNDHELTEPTEDLALFLTQLSGTRVLDIGCGWGRLAYHFLDAELQYLGVDYSAAMVQAAQLSTPDTSFVVMSGTNLNVLSESIDGIWCCCMLHQVPKLELLTHLREWQRVLRPGGLLYIVLPDEESSYERMLYDENDQPEMWYAAYQPSELETALYKAGFHHIKSFCRKEAHSFTVTARVSD